MKATRAFIVRTIGAVRLLARDGRIPKPLRWLAGLGLLPIPGPIDEAILLLIAPIFLIFYREPLREAWSRPDDPSFVGHGDKDMAAAFEAARGSD